MTTLHQYLASDKFVAEKKSQRKIIDHHAKVPSVKHPKIRPTNEGK